MRKIFDEISLKEQQIYQAVARLMEQGQNLETLKVSEIAAEAGIGKGTVYEYFKSKEEIIGKALLYDVAGRIMQVTELVKQAPDFNGRIYAILDWLGDNFLNQKSFLQLYELLCQGNGMAKNALKKAMTEKGLTDDAFFEGLKQLGMTGVEEGLISDKIPVSLIGVTIFTHIAGFVTSIQKKDWIGEISLDELKHFFYHGIIKSLG